MTIDIEPNPFPETVRAIACVRRFPGRPEQVKPFESGSKFLETLTESARISRSVECATTCPGSDTKLLQSKVDAWKSDCELAIRQFQEIAVGVSSSNVATSTLSFVPVVGVFFAIGTVVVGLATMPAIEARTNRMNEQLK
ncbi:hypothetical protein BCR44DRAFT_1457799 [Catenaria anguillulae PL171]|uniref:Uncharacterized protein n=1 Tax=Catenaria anguillulae PL171 TaxID=765915 RepID=A0A1Y2I3F2_9FUNG|nr:hypothetical protein BCR44DRAFT_1457799 [Catenaria anguillulae PL171]